MNTIFNSEHLIDEVRAKKPLIHQITNYVTVNDCANITLASGASPVMADDIREVEEIVTISSALVLNIGTLNERTVTSMLAAGKAANKKGIPVILDPVGAGASRLRTETAKRLIEEVKISVIRGNISEIKTLLGEGGNTRGVDADDQDALGEDAVETGKRIAAALARKTGSVVAITGVIDAVSDGGRIFLIRNGHPMMADVTGTGCMSTALVGSFCGALEDQTEATAAAIAAMGLAGELAYESVKKSGLGTGSYRTLIIDAISRMTDQTLKDGGKISLG